MHTTSYTKAPGDSLLTVLKDPFHVQAVCGAGLVVGTPLQIVGQLSCAGVVYHAGATLAYRICGIKEVNI